MRRTEYPRPQLQRDSYFCLNGKWQFAIDAGESLPERGLFNAENYPLEIEVPFCPESVLSGIHNVDFLNAVAYRREVKTPEITEKERLLLHFGACDYETFCYIDGVIAGRHLGGYSSFTFDITQFVKGKESFILNIYAKDHNRSGQQGRGKQSPAYFSQGCDYTRTTGIWQSVWMEVVPSVYVSSLNLNGSFLKEELSLILNLNKYSRGRLTATIYDNGKEIRQKQIPYFGRTISAIIPIDNARSWSPEDPHLYQVELHLEPENEKSDFVKSYFGMRDVELKGKTFYLNGKPRFLRTVLDQGFYPDGVYTAPDDNDLKKDILLSQKAGFNGARLHQKVFEERFLYYCDQLGYLVFEEYPDAGSNRNDTSLFLPILSEWAECMERDISHPSIIGWCPYNETCVERDSDLLRQTYRFTRLLDPTRPVIDTSGYTHEITDIYDVHNYEQDPEKFAEAMKAAATADCFRNFPEKENYENQPYFVSEYGGIFWADEATTGWGYGTPPSDKEAFYQRYEALTRTLLSNPHICGYCYTQLTDVEQEQNGIYRFDRSEKFNMDRIRKINTAPAAIETHAIGNV